MFMEHFMSGEVMDLAILIQFTGSGMLVLRLEMLEKNESFEGNCQNSHKIGHCV